MEWISLLQTLGGIIGGLGIGMFTKSGRKRDKADADAKVMEAQRLMIDNYEERIKDLHAIIDRYNDDEVHHSERVRDLNHTIDSLTQRNREISDRVWNAEQESNRINRKLAYALELITTLTEERDHYKQWQCQSSICVKGKPDPEGRQPPNPKIVGLVYKDYPKHTAVLLDKETS